MDDKSEMYALAQALRGTIEGSGSSRGMGGNATLSLPSGGTFGVSGGVGRYGRRGFGGGGELTFEAPIDKNSSLQAGITGNFDRPPGSRLTGTLDGLNINYRRSF